MSHLYHLCYMSQISPDIPASGVDSEVTRIIDSARVNNARVGLTGCLIFTGRHFLQILEGAADDVEQVFGAIAHDPRHRRVTVLSLGSIETRQFPETWMGFADSSGLAAADLAAITAAIDASSHALDVREVKTILGVLAQTGNRRATADLGLSLQQA
ncbi:BLUF domain-containing protein [Polymorphum gilvum]|uniref:Cyclic diguanylate phosphodiesterase domain protein n=1 Tax=Polymorphum gilvum (strain LMG 25793 / CGMCC 1.9160 / SL003B-26A1) TaxID=991905 RepID=F2J5Y4_POLGS|nr:BLUF domain-containing protein [Polymorphum gilvum]ADZ71238.1 Cyclic diguanylate phosphodiesterase domain protein [Polymorphum gilvum SL003B-26A1]